MNFSISHKRIDALLSRVRAFSAEKFVVIVSILSGLIATYYSYVHGYIIAYGDAESHLNIAKRVVDSITPGFAQLGGIWLPLPHILLIPFVYFDFLWKTGLAGSIVSGIASVISALYTYKLTYLLTKNRTAGVVAGLVFSLNLNILYMQSTPMTELTLIVFFMLSSYYFILFLQNDRKILYLLFAAAFGFLASLSRYDGWALVLMEAGILFLFYLPYSLNLKVLFEKIKNLFSRKSIKESQSILKAREIDSGTATWSRWEGRLIMFATLAFFGILIWFIWGGLILGDPLYFTHSQFSAKSQQNSWLSKGELPAYKHIGLSLLYYFVTSASNAGIVITVLALIGLAYFCFDKNIKYRWYVLLTLAVPFIFNVATLYLGQSVIFIPSLTPVSFEWRLFNVRYGVMMIPFIAILVGYLITKVKPKTFLVIGAACLMQIGLFVVGYSHAITLQDGTIGLSSFIAKTPDAQNWLDTHYDYGMLLTDDYARTISIVRLPVKMNNVIYIGNKPYWAESLIAPEKYARWIVMQKDDTLWTTIYEDPAVQGRLYKYFNKVYTSNDILIFRRIDDGTQTQNN